LRALRPLPSLRFSGPATKLHFGFFLAPFPSIIFTYTLTINLERHFSIFVKRKKIVKTINRKIFSIILKNFYEKTLQHQVSFFRLRLANKMNKKGVFYGN
jgi:hypothetical protein